jgi:hypothetical protein
VSQPAIVPDFVSHNGNIDAHSKRGDGSRFGARLRLSLFSARLRRIRPSSAR